MFCPRSVFLTLNNIHENTNTINQEHTSVQVLCEGHGALVEAVSKLHPDPELDEVRHLDNTRLMSQ